MVRSIKPFGFGVLMLALAIPLIAQERTRPASSGGGDRGVSAAPSARTSAPSAPAVSTRSTAPGVYSGSSANLGSSSRNFASNPNFGNSGGGGTPALPRLQGTSFVSYNQYFWWNDFLWRLQSRYLMDSWYFSRFYRNREPLLTPRLQRLALRDPLALSRQMVLAVDELAAMLDDYEAGRPVSKEQIQAKAEEIREFAKAIRKDQLLPYVDQRKDADILKNKNVNALGLNAIDELKAMVVDLNSQLRNLYDQSSTATVSVSSLSQPSFESLTKGIDKLCKVIENSAKRI